MPFVGSQHYLSFSIIIFGDSGPGSSCRFTEGFSKSHLMGLPVTVAALYADPAGRGRWCRGDLFFVLSGFVLSLPVTQFEQPAFWQFLVKRFCRIYLPFAVTLANCCGVCSNSRNNVRECQQMAE
jgi:hypothetical protein